MAGLWHVGTGQRSAARMRFSLMSAARAVPVLSSERALRFVIHCVKALRKAITNTFGPRGPIQRCHSRLLGDPDREALAHRALARRMKRKLLRQPLQGMRMASAGYSRPHPSSTRSQSRSRELQSSREARDHRRFTPAGG